MNAENADENLFIYIYFKKNIYSLIISTKNFQWLEKLRKKNPDPK